MNNAAIIPLLAVLALPACETYRATPMVDTSGPLTPSDLPAPAQAGDGNPYEAFARIYQKALQSGATEDAKLLRTRGFALIWNNCSDFFARRGNVQQSLSLFRDTTSAMTPIATAAFSIARAATSAVPILSLSQAVTSGGINIVAQNFLFGADNIDDVRTLTLNALAAHVAKVKEEAAKAPNEAGFDWSTNQLMENQAICQPAKILALSKEAIAKGNVKGFASASPKKEAEAEVQKTAEKRTASAGGKATPPPAGGAAANAAAAVADTAILPARIGVRVEN